MRKLKDLEGKRIYITNHKQKMDVLTYMELSGVTWNSGSLPTKANINIEYPLYLSLKYGKLRYVGKVDRIPIVISPDKIINYDDLNINWYKLLYNKQLGSKFLLHIPTDERLTIENHINGYNGYNYKLEELTIVKDHILKSSDNIKLYRRGNELSIKFISGDYLLSKSDDMKLFRNGSELSMKFNNYESDVHMNITKGGFIKDINHDFIEINEVLFKKTSNDI